MLSENLSCVEYTDIRILSGKSLTPALFPGDQLLFLGGYYRCNPVKTGDLVLYRWGEKKCSQICARLDGRSFDSQ
jgi:hypothetical protein